MEGQKIPYYALVGEDVDSCLMTEFMFFSRRRKWQRRSNSLRDIPGSSLKTTNTTTITSPMDSSTESMRAT